MTRRDLLTALLLFCSFLPSLNHAQSNVDNVDYLITPAEAAAGVTPTNYGYPPLNVLRYGADPTDSTESSTPLQNAINVASQMGGGVVLLPPGKYKTSNTLTLVSGVTLSGYSATLDYTSTGWALATVTTGYSEHIGVQGLEVDIGASAAGAFDLVSLQYSVLQDITIGGVSNQSAVGLVLGVNTTGAINADGNRNNAINLFNNVRIATQIGTGVELVGNATVPTVVTLNTFLNFQIGGNGLVYVYGVDFNQYCDSNNFAGVTRISLADPAGAAAVGVVFNSATPSNNMGVYAESFQHLAVDTFGTPSGDARVGLRFNWTKQNHIDYYYQQPVAAGGSIQTTSNTQSTWVRHVNDSGAVSELMLIGTTINFDGLTATLRGGDTNLTLGVAANHAVCLGGSVGAQCGNDSLRVYNVSSAVDGVQVVGATTGNTPGISAFGDDPSINLYLQSKGGSSILMIPGGNAPTAAFISDGSFLVPPTTVASLPPCVPDHAGAMHPVSDAVGTATGGTLTGGGINYAIALCNGTNWTLH